MDPILSSKLSTLHDRPDSTAELNLELLEKFSDEFDTLMTEGRLTITYDEACEIVFQVTNKLFRCISMREGHMCGPVSVKANRIILSLMSVKNYVNAVFSGMLRSCHQMETTSVHVHVYVYELQEYVAMLLDNWLPENENIDFMPGQTWQVLNIMRACFNKKGDCKIQSDLSVMDSKLCECIQKFLNCENANTINAPGKDDPSVDSILHLSAGLLHLPNLTVKILQVPGVDVNKLNCKGETPLLKLIKCSCFKEVRSVEVKNSLLEQESTDLHIKDNDQQTALDYAIKALFNTEEGGRCILDTIRKIVSHCSITPEMLERNLPVLLSWDIPDSIEDAFLETAQAFVHSSKFKPRQKPASSASFVEKLFNNDVNVKWERMSTDLQMRLIQTVSQHYSADENDIKAGFNKLITLNLNIQETGVEETFKQIVDSFFKHRLILKKISGKEIMSVISSRICDDSFPIEAARHILKYFIGTCSRPSPADKYQIADCFLVHLQHVPKENATDQYLSIVDMFLDQPIYEFALPRDKATIGLCLIPCISKLQKTAPCPEIAVEISKRILQHANVTTEIVNYLAQLLFSLPVDKKTETHFFSILSFLVETHKMDMTTIKVGRYDDCVAFILSLLNKAPPHPEYSLQILDLLARYDLLITKSEDILAELSKWMLKADGHHSESLCDKLHAAVKALSEQRVQFPFGDRQATFDRWEDIIRLPGFQVNRKDESGNTLLYDISECSTGLYQGKAIDNQCFTRARVVSLIKDLPWDVHSKNNFGDTVVDVYKKKAPYNDYIILNELERLGEQFPPQAVSHASEGETCATSFLSLTQIFF